MLLSLIEEFCPSSTITGTTNGEVDQPKQGSNMQRDKSAGDSPRSRPTDPVLAPSRRRSSSPTPAPIALQRTSSNQSGDAVEELLDDSASSSSSNASGSSRRNSTSRPRSRFITFLPPGSQEAANRRTMSSSTASTVPSRHGSKPGQSSARRSSSSDEDAYPDPYGIITDNPSHRLPSTASRGSVTRSTPPQASQDRDRRRLSNQTSPAPANRDRSQLAGQRSASNRPSPVLAPTNPASKKSSGRNDNQNASTGKKGSNSQEKAIASSASMQTNGIEDQLKNEYRKRRCAPLLRWWRCYIDDVS